MPTEDVLLGVCWCSDELFLIDLRRAFDLHTFFSLFLLIQVISFVFITFQISHICNLMHDFPIDRSDLIIVYNFYTHLHTERNGSWNLDAQLNFFIGFIHLYWYVKNVSVKLSSDNCAIWLKKEAELRSSFSGVHIERCLERSTFLTFFNSIIQK